MGWDVLILKLKDPGPRAKDLDESKVLGLGDPVAVRDRINAALPGVDWSEPTWGYVFMLGCHLEFNLKAWNGFSMAIHVHGTGDPVTPIVALCRANGWVAFDTTVGDYIDPVRPSSSGWKESQAFRDKVVQRLESGLRFERKN